MSNESEFPDNASVRNFLEALGQHNCIARVEETADTRTVNLTLQTGAGMRIRVTNIYCVGEADVVEILREDPSIDAIVTLSAWNRFTSDAWDYCSERQKGVFTWKGFFGALNYRKFWLYHELSIDLNDYEVAAEKRRRRREWN